MDVAYETQAPDSLDPRSSLFGGRSPGRSAVRGQHQQGAVPSHLLPLGTEDIAEECSLLQHTRGGRPRRAPTVQGLQAIGEPKPHQPYNKPYNKIH